MGPEVQNEDGVAEYGRVQGSLARDEKGPVIQNHSCMKEPRLDQPYEDKCR